MSVWSFDVTVSTHDLLCAGIVAGRFSGSQHTHHRVVVAANTHAEASLLAAQMASCHGICTGVYTRI